MWSYVQSQEHQRWLWHAIDPNTGKILAYTLGDHKDEAFPKLKELLEPLTTNTSISSISPSRCFFTRWLTICTGIPRSLNTRSQAAARPGFP